MAYEKNPNEIGVLYLDKTKDGLGYRVGGKAFPVPPSGVTVDLIPFAFTGRDGEEKRGLRVVKVQAHKQEQVPGWNDL